MALLFEEDSSQNQFRNDFYAPHEAIPSSKPFLFYVRLLDQLFCLKSQLMVAHDIIIYIAISPSIFFF